MKRKTVVACLLMSLMTVAAYSGEQRSGSTGLPPLTLDSLTGRDSFNFYCATCHGLDGRGAGPVAASLKRQPADLTVLTRRHGGTFPRSDVISFVNGTGRPVPAHGPSDMPVWGPILRALEGSDSRVKVRIENIVSYIESLQVR